MEQKELTRKYHFGGWQWVVILVAILGTFPALSLRLGTIDPSYEARVKVQITAPQQEDVTLFETYRSTSVRDEVMVARNNFSEITRSAEIRRRTIEQLGLQGDEVNYGLDIQMSRDSDFVYITARSANPQMAEQIANTHTNAAISYYGEIRAKPAAAAKAFLSQELLKAEKKLQDDEEALSNFRMQNGIGVLSDELSSYQSLIQQVTSERNKRVLEGASIASVQATETLLKQLLMERERIIALGPEYNRLDESVKESKAEYQLLLDKVREAKLKEDNVATANFIQVVESASIISGGSPIRFSSLFLALAGALGAGVLAALGLQFLGAGASQVPLPSLRRSTGYEVGSLRE